MKDVKEEKDKEINDLMEKQRKNLEELKSAQCEEIKDMKERASHELADQTERLQAEKREMLDIKMKEIENLEETIKRYENDASRLNEKIKEESSKNAYSSEEVTSLKQEIGRLQNALDKASMQLNSAVERASKLEVGGASFLNAANVASQPRLDAPNLKILLSVWWFCFSLCWIEARSY